jgi:hypothetical protein
LIPRIATDNAQMGNELLIRRSRVRNPPGSLSYATAPAQGAGESVGAGSLKRAARVAVWNAIRLGKLAKGPCEQADSSCSGPAQAHHDDYTQPLVVRWLCRSHHARTHRGESRNRCRGCLRVLALRKGEYCSSDCVALERSDAATIAQLFAHDDPSARCSV